MGPISAYPAIVDLSGLVFAWPMARGLALAVWDDEASLSLNAEASQDSALVGLLPQGASVTISDRQGILCRRKIWRSKIC